MNTKIISVLAGAVILIAAISIATWVLIINKEDSATDTGSTTSSSSSTQSTIALSSSSISTTTSTTVAASKYIDGTYFAEGSYNTPETTENIEVTLTIQDDTITDVEVQQDPQERESELYQAKFKQGIAGIIVGKKLDDISVSKVNGSSLTSIGFNKAIKDIKAEAIAD